MTFLSGKLNSLASRVHLISAPPTEKELRVVRKFADEKMGGIYTSLIDSVSKKKPELIKEVGGIKYVQNDTISRRFVTSAKSFFSMPIELLDAVAKKFPDSKLNSLSILQKHRESVKLENEIQAAQGLYRNLIKDITKYSPKGNIPDVSKMSDLNSVFLPVTRISNKELNKMMAVDVAKYDTKKERFATRIISGVTAALFLGTDFYNKSVQKGKSVEDAKKEQHLKQGQEIKENLCEGITQFAVFSCFSRTVNKSVWAPAIIGTAIGLVSRVISRKTSKMPLTRIKVAPKAKASSALSMTDFVKSAKSGETQALLQQKQAENLQNVVEENKPKKGAVLSVKNLLGFCALSIAAGYALRFGANHTKIGQNITRALKKHEAKFNADTTRTVLADEKTLGRLINVLNTQGETELGKQVQIVQNKAIRTGRSVAIGTEYKTVNLFGKVEVKIKDLRRLATAPFRFVKELVSYPYKIVTKLEDAVRNQRIKAKGGIPPVKSSPINDKYQIKNLYKRFIEFQEKYGDDDKKLAEEFGKYVKDTRIALNNEVSSSKGNNSKIAVIAQTLGTLTGMWFNMNDEFNSSIRNGSTKEEAEKDARLRGINKFIRMTVQLIISGSLNDIFSKQYNSSLASSAAVVAASTILTDSASRVLSGMPTKKMTKEELDNYQKRHKEGAMKGYYKFIDKLAS